MFNEKYLCVGVPTDTFDDIAISARYGKCARYQLCGRKRLFEHQPSSDNTWLSTDSTMRTSMGSITGVTPCWQVVWLLPHICCGLWRINWTLLDVGSKISGLNKDFPPAHMLFIRPVCTDSACTADNWLGLLRALERGLGTCSGVHLFRDDCMIKA